MKPRIPLILAGCALAAPLLADVTIGTPGPGTTQDCVTFGCAHQAQFVYDASFFPGPLSITEIQFYNSGPDSPDTFDPATYTFKLSTTSATGGTLSSTFASNVGGDEAVFTTVVLTATSIPGTFSFTGTPFNYNPANGNLLLEVDKPDGTEAFSGFTDYNSSLPGVGRVFSLNNGGTGTVDANYAPVVTFISGSPVPEPAQLTGAGLALLGVMGATAYRRNRRK